MEADRESRTYRPPQGANRPKGAAVELYFDRDRRGDLLTSPFVTSWIADARSGDLHDRDYEARRAAWAAWAVESLVWVKGSREYPALVLPGSFYDPKGQVQVHARPHLEIPRSTFQAGDPAFCDRLALCGNGLEFPWWLYWEVVAAKRAIFFTPRGSIDELKRLLVSRSADLVRGLEMVTNAVRPQWQRIEELLALHSEDLVEAACGDFSAEEVDEFLPGAAELDLTIRFEEKLRERNAQWVARRVGVWQICGRGPDGPFALGVLTPRLTANSTLTDQLFAPAAEGLGAVLVRNLVLRRIARAHLDVQPQVLTYKIGIPVPQVPTSDDTPRPAGTRAFIRRVTAKPGAKPPKRRLKLRWLSFRRSPIRRTPGRCSPTGPATTICSPSHGTRSRRRSAPPSWPSNAARTRTATTSTWCCRWRGTIRVGWCASPSTEAADQLDRGLGTVDVGSSSMGREAQPLSRRALAASNSASDSAPDACSSASFAS